MSMTQEDLLRFLRGLEKKHGRDVEVVLKYRTNSGKVRKRMGRLIGLRGEDEVGLHNSAKGATTWYELERVDDAWKRGTDRTVG